MPLAGVTAAVAIALLAAASAAAPAWPAAGDEDSLPSRITLGSTPGVLPRWPPTYNLSRSTVVQPCNSSGYFDAAFLGQFGLVSVDWSNAKAQWANARPMDCEERLVAQAQLIKAANPDTKVFVYRNLVKALPWMATVRAALVNASQPGSAQGDWFLRYAPSGPLPNGSYYAPPCDDSVDPPLCSQFYHDQLQTPEHPRGDGSCVAAPCDCGGVPCGEYLWAHDSGGPTLSDYLIQRYLLGPSGLQNSAISGFYLDDQWHNRTNPGPFCDASPIGGPSEEDPHCVTDMGLTQPRVNSVRDAWNATLYAALDAVDGHAPNPGWEWHQSTQVDGTPPPGAECVAFFRSSAARTLVNSTLFFYWTNGSHTHPLPAVQQDVATFLLLRGAYGFIGYTWSGCTDDAVPGFGQPWPYTIPPVLSALDPGVPLGGYAEQPPGSSVFVRQWSKATVSLNCTDWAAAIEPVA